MEVQPRQPTVKAGTDNFTGDVWFDVIARARNRPVSASTWSASRPVPGTRGTLMRSVRRST